ncbi:MAG: AMP-binding protein [Capnocytophaga sp.]|nr:AMP-binding protein [Capnocytophaga sp.]
MESITFKYINKSFKINDLCFSNKQELQKKAQSFLEEKQLYLQKIGEFLLHWLDDNDTIELATSGTTGVPKKIRIKKQFMVNSSLLTGEFLQLKEKDTALLALPADFIAGKMMLVRAMVLGLSLDTVIPSSIPLVNINKNYDFIALTPMQALYSLSELHLVKKIILGGAPITAELEEKLQKIPTQIYATYGMTETVSHIAMRKISQQTTKPIYTAMPYVYFEKDERNCLIINCEKVSEEQIITNDYVHLFSETQFEWKGRYDNIINSGGVKIFPEKVEFHLSKIIKSPFFIWYEKDDILGQKVILFVEGKEEQNVNLLQKIREEKELNKYEIPKKIYYLEKFSYTLSGKIQRNESVKILLNAEKC